VALALLTGGCASSDGEDGAGGGVHVVASFYPLAEAARVVGGALVSVENLTPPGVEPHDLELAPDDLETIQSADLVLLVGGGFQPAIEEAVADAEGTVVDALEGLATLPPPEEEEQEGGGHEGEELTADPHVWLDPTLFGAIVERLSEALSEVAAGDAAEFEANAQAYIAEIETLDGEFQMGLATCKRRLMVVNHAAFGYLADAYDLEQVAISGVSPEAEPDAQRLGELAGLVQREGVTTIFTEELVSPEVAETLADEAGITTAVLNPLEGLTPEEVDAGEDYLSVMRTNLETLRAGLGCS
jgi:zinc transport system substrate-binding protein